MKIRLRRLKNFQYLASAQSRSVMMDQGADRGGEDIGFRPTELWLIGLCGCSVNTMIRFANERGWPVNDIQVHAEDTVNENGNISAITFHAVIDGDLGAEQKRELFDHVRSNCKLLRTVNPEIRVTYREAEDELPAGSGCTLEGGNCCM